jgi:hypothetical protein
MKNPKKIEFSDSLLEKTNSLDLTFKPRRSLCTTGIAYFWVNLRSLTLSNVFETNSRSWGHKIWFILRFSLGLINLSH